MKKITSFLALMIFLCLCLSACRLVGRGGETRETSTQLTMPDIEMPDKHEGDYELPPGEEPDVTVIDE